jgi:hypothetical protein
VSDSSVTGETWVGGIGGKTLTAVSTYNDNTSVYFSGGAAGGVFGFSSSIIDSASSGRIAALNTAGVGGNFGDSVGGLVGGANVIVNSSATGNVTGRKYVGGLAGSGKLILFSEASGNVMGTGEMIGGLVGAIKPDQHRINFIHFDNLSGSKHHYENPSLEFDGYGKPDVRGQYIGILYSQATGNVWGGMGPRDLACDGDLREVFGEFGSTECDDTLGGSSTANSKTGGLVGQVGQTLLQGNVATGTVRSPNQSGGIVGYGYGPFFAFDNLFTGQVSVSSPQGAMGNLAGTIKMKFCAPYPKSRLNQIMDGNTWPQPQADVTWAFGELETFDGLIRHQDL